MRKLNHDGRMELFGEMIDIFENFLDDHEVWIPDPDRSEDEEDVNIRGANYDWIAERLDALLVRWNLIEKGE